MGLPFTPDQFIDTFAEYNRAFWFVAGSWWLLCAGALMLAWRRPRHSSHHLTSVLAALWAWNAGAYHIWFFARINPAAWLFAALFFVQAGLLASMAAQGHLEYFSGTGWRRRLGAALVLYALAYPALTMASGHRYPATPTFGVPCPTTILTIGLLLTSVEGTALKLAAVPILWAFVGGSAAILLSVPSDYVLLIAGVVMAVVSITHRRPPACDRQLSWDLRLLS
jgi:hypothetical protein